jgi:acetylornithine deacetylase/succinyl-diaminopimelate desuccinylase-like protein
MGSGQRVLPANQLADFQHPRHRRHQRDSRSASKSSSIFDFPRPARRKACNSACAILDKHSLDYDIKWTLSARPFLTGRGPLADAATTAIRDICGIDTELSTTGGTSDGRFIAEICKQMLEIGPVNATSHKIDECIAVDALPTLSAIYRRILEQLMTA